MCTTTMESALAELEVAQKKMPQKIEFVVEDFTKNLPEIISNCKNLQAWAQERTELDRSLVLTTEEDFEQARTRCATLNKIKEQVDAKRKEVKKLYTQPYDVFEAEIKKVINTLQTARDNLWNQITVAENEIKQKKENEYKEYWTSKGITERKWEQIADKRWLNKGMSSENVKKSIDEIAGSIKSDVETIKSLGSPFEVELLAYYERGYALGDVVKHNIDLQARQKALEAAKVAAQSSSRPEPSEATVPENPVSSDAETNNRQTEDAVKIVDFRIWATSEQLKKLREFLVSCQIKYGRVPTNE